MSLQERLHAANGPEAYESLQNVRAQKAMEAAAATHLFTRELEADAGAKGVADREAALHARHIAVQQVTGEHQIVVQHPQSDKMH